MRQVFGERKGSRLATLALMAGLTLGAIGCRVNVDDLKRWQTTENGPTKLVAVLAHDKYDKELRVEAAWSLVEMKKRGGQYAGLKLLIDQLPNLAAKDRRDVMEGLWKKLRPKVEAGLSSVDGKFADPTVVYKDATFALFSAAREDRPGQQKLDVDAKILDEMAAALTDWAAGKEGDDVNVRLQQLETRLDNTAQQYGVEQILRSVGVIGTKRIPALLTAKLAIKSVRLDVIVRVVTEVKGAGSDEARAELSNNFAKLLSDTINGAYADSVRAETDEALAKNPDGKKIVAEKNNPEKDPLKNPYVAYFLKVRDERLQQLFTLAKQVGGKGVATTLMGLAMNAELNKENRAFALAALEGNFDTKTDEAMKSFLALAKSNAPDEVKHVALVRLAAYPPEQAVQGYYTLFGEQNWKIRYDAGMQILGVMQKIGDKSKTNVKEFIGKLPDKPEEKMGLGEGSDYARAMSALPKEMNAKQIVLSGLESKSMGAQLVALGWYLGLGTKEDLPAVEKYAASKDPLPKCKDVDDCKWDVGCPVPKKDKPEEFETKPLSTVGDYVNYCVKVQIEMRAKAPKPDDKKDDDKKDGDKK